jgi:hypothetical protein
MRAFTTELQPHMINGDKNALERIVQDSLYYSLVYGRAAIAKNFFNLITEIEKEGDRGLVVLLDVAILSDDRETMEMCILEKFKRERIVNTSEEKAYFLNNFKYGEDCSAVLLHEASYSNKANIVKYFLENGADK